MQPILYCLGTKWPTLIFRYYATHCFPLGTMQPLFYSEYYATHYPFLGTMQPMSYVRYYVTHIFIQVLCNLGYCILSDIVQLIVVRLLHTFYLWYHESFTPNTMPPLWTEWHNMCTTPLIVLSSLLCSGISSWANLTWLTLASFHSNFLCLYHATMTSAWCWVMCYLWIQCFSYPDTLVQILPDPSNLRSTILSWLSFLFQA